ncbi:hypothetical protein Ahia01_000664100 [Argonauta hians]
MDLRRYVSADDLLSLYDKDNPSRQQQKKAVHGRKYRTLQRTTQHAVTPTPVIDSPKLKLDLSPLSPSRIPDNSSLSSAVKSAYISNEYLRIRDFINRTDPDVLQQILLRTLEYRNSKDIIALGIIFPRNHFPTYNNYHCARCHKQYNPMDKEHCLLRHSAKYVRKIQQDDQGSNFFCRLCGKTFYLRKVFTYTDNISNYHTGYCFIGLHTNDARLVRYGAEAKTCEEYGCVEFYV